MEGELLGVRAHEVDHAWPHVIDFIEQWIEREPLTADEIKDALKTAKAQLWCMVADGKIRGIWVTRIEIPKKCTWGLIWGCAGDFLPYKQTAVEMYSMIEQWLRDQGCEFVEWSGRAGWQRIFPGYEKHSVVMRKIL